MNDHDLLKVYEYAEIEEHEKNSLAEQHGITSLTNLLDKLEDLKKAKYRVVKRRRLFELSKVVIWYQDYRLVHGEPPNLERDLNEDAIEDFQANEMTIPFPQGESLSHVLTVLQRDTKKLRFSSFQQ